MPDTHNSSPSPDGWERLKILSVVLVTVIIPLAIALTGNWYATALKDKEIQTKYVELAISILSQQPTDDNKSVREWAVQIINYYSAVPIDKQTKGEFLTEKLTPTAPYSVSGVWWYSMNSDVSHNTTRGTLRLLMDGSSITGVLENTFDKTKGIVQGEYTNNTLEMSRDTGLNTIQNYTLRKVSGNKLQGEFWNVAKQSGQHFYPDKGTIDIER